MPSLRVTWSDLDGSFEGALEALRARIGVPAPFTAEQLDSIRATDPFASVRSDRTDIPLVTIDPQGSRDLDQALWIGRRDAGYRVVYAIADVGSFVEPDSELDRAVNERVVTLYFPDGSVPLHPPVLSADGASLLPGEDRRAVLWDISLDRSGAVTRFDVSRSTVRSRRALSYDEAQSEIDRCLDLDAPLALLREVGQLRIAAEFQRGGLQLPLADQEIKRRKDGYRLTFRRSLPVEDWNAQVSLLTGMLAADMMVGAGCGILRTLPRPSEHVIDDLRRVAAALDIPWPKERSYVEELNSLALYEPADQALAYQALKMFRGAGYSLIGATAAGHDTARAPKDDGTGTPPIHGAIAAPYAHVTAPLRRLVDRYANEIVLAIAAGRPVPEWVSSALPGLPTRMAEGAAKQSECERASVDLAEACVLLDRVGQVLYGVVVSSDPSGSTIVIDQPAIMTRVKAASLELGQVVSLRVAAVSAQNGSIELTPT